MEKYFRIGEISEEKGYTIQCLRYYDKIGLIKPIYINPETNYRYYSSQQLYKLEVIKYLKNVGVSNSELLFLCRAQDLDIWNRFLAKLSKHIREKIDMLIQSIAKIDSLRSRISYLKTVNENSEIYYHHFDTRYVIVRECHSLPTTDCTISGFTSLYKDVSRYSLDNTFQSGAILTYDAELGLSYDNIYVEVSNCPHFSNVPSHRILPAGLYICINNNLCDAESRSKLLLDYIKESGMTPKFVSEEYVFTDFVGYENPHMALQILAEL